MIVEGRPPARRRTVAAAAPARGVVGGRILVAVCVGLFCLDDGCVLLGGGGEVVVGVSAV